MSGRGRQLLWKIVDILGNCAGMVWLVPPPEVLVRMPAPLPRVDPRELDEWLASVLGPDPTDRDHE